MAVTLLHHTHARSAAEPHRVPATVLALAVAPLALDLLAQRQHVPSLGLVALAGSALAALVLAFELVHRPTAAWLWAAVLAFAASAALRLAGVAEGPLLGVLGVTALGVAGAFLPSERLDVSPLCAREAGTSEMGMGDTNPPPANDLPSAA